VLVQLEHLQTYPSSAAALERKALSLHGWVHDFETEQVFGDRSQDGQFVPIERNKLHSSIGPPEVAAHLGNIVMNSRKRLFGSRDPRGLIDADHREMFFIAGLKTRPHSLIQLVHLWNEPCN